MKSTLPHVFWLHKEASTDRVCLTLSSMQTSLLLQVLDFARMDDDDENPCIAFADNLYAAIIQTVEASA